MRNKELDSMIVTSPFQLEIFYNSMILHITPSSTIKHPPPSNSRLKAHNYGALGETLSVEKALKLWSQLTQLGSASLHFHKTLKSYKSTFIPSRWHLLPPFCSLLVYITCIVPFSTYYLLWGKAHLLHHHQALLLAKESTGQTKSWNQLVLCLCQN